MVLMWIRQHYLQVLRRFIDQRIADFLIDGPGQGSYQLSAHPLHVLQGLSVLPQAEHSKRCVIQQIINVQR